MSKIRMSPFLKWAGGKRWLVAKHTDWFCLDTNRHLEPFLGSGAVFFHIAPKRAILSDTNEELISGYKAIRKDPNGIVRHLKHHQSLHSTSYYYEMRERKPRTPLTRAARLLYLNRTCFNGLYRVNLDGVFNVPKGTKSTVILPADDFPKVSRILRSATLSAVDFEETIQDAKEGDFLYIDPPYTVKHNNNNFVKYNEHIFSWSDQVRLAKCALDAAHRGARVLISNANHPSVSELYKANLWAQLKVDRFSKLASSAEYRRDTTELVVSNYLSLDGDREEPRT